MKGRLDDVGEKIGGARKDIEGGGMWASQVPSGEKIPPLSKLWPKLNIQKIIEKADSARFDSRWIVAAVAVLRSEIPPRTRRRLLAWGKDVDNLHSVAIQVMNGEIKDNEHLANKLSDEYWGTRIPDGQRICNKINILEEANYPTRLEHVDLKKLHVVCWKQDITDTEVFLFYGNTRIQNTGMNAIQNAFEELETVASVEKESQKTKTKESTEDDNYARKPPRILLYRIVHSGKYKLGFKRHGDVFNVAENDKLFTDRHEASEYYHEHTENILKCAVSMLEPIQLRNPHNRTRVGVDYRKGQKITPGVTAVRLTLEYPL